MEKGESGGSKSKGHLQTERGKGYKITEANRKEKGN